MLFAIDGACKRNGEPTCVSVGVAWCITDDGDMGFKSKFEHESTSQRGELNGLTEALEFAAEHARDDEDIIIVTDSEYMFNTIALEWWSKWRANRWYGAQGDIVKNVDMWKHVAELMDKLAAKHCEVSMQWTKGHLVHYTPGNIKKAMEVDPTGVELYTRIAAVANRPADIGRIVQQFKEERVKHKHMAPPDAIALEWAIVNATADALASYIVKIFDDVLI